MVEEKRFERRIIIQSLKDDIVANVLCMLISLERLSIDHCSTNPFEYRAIYAKY